MFFKLLLLLTIVPILELILILDVHQYVQSHFGSTRAFLLTIGSIVVTGVVGARLAKQQGFEIFRRAQNTMKQGEVPNRELMEGFFLIIGAVTLITPGYITDLIGFTLLLPWSRHWLVNRFETWFLNQVKIGKIRVHHGQTSHSRTFGGSPWGNDRAKSSSDVIDVEPLHDQSKQND